VNRLVARTRRALSEPERGLTLVELLVAMVITSILLVAVGTVTMATLRAVRTLNAKTSTSANARVGLEALTRTLRAAAIPTREAAAITSATGSSITFYSNVNRKSALIDSGVVVPTKMEYYQDGSCLYEAQTPARKLTPANNTAPLYAWDTGRTVRCLLRTTTQNSLFSYFTSAAQSAAALPIGTGLTATVMATVQSVQVTMTVVDPATGTVSGVPIFGRVTLDNVVLAAGGTV
jgi:prepilin-type N-terminal cleavage/methylation domain-containing protein